jgi:hypothetical protein
LATGYLLSPQEDALVFIAAGWFSGARLLKIMILGLGG